VDLAKYPLENNEDESVCVTLDAARIVFLTPSEGLLSLRDGALYLLRMDTPAGVVRRLSVVPTRLSSVVSTCLVVDEGRRFLFQGSRLGDSLLLRLKVERVFGLACLAWLESMDNRDDGDPRACVYCR